MPQIAQNIEIVKSRQKGGKVLIIYELGAAYNIPLIAQEIEGL